MQSNRQAAAHVKRHSYEKDWVKGSREEHTAQQKMLSHIWKIKPQGEIVRKVFKALWETVPWKNLDKNRWIVGLKYLQQKAQEYSDVVTAAAFLGERSLS